MISFTSGGMKTYAYDPVTNTWRTRANPTRSHEALALVGQAGSRRLLAVGGIRPGDDPPDNNVPAPSELYTP